MIRYLLSLAFCLPLCAATYYVRTDGDDAQSGLVNSATGAWEHIAFAASQVNPGDTVMVDVGTYPEYVVLSRPGTSSSPINWYGAASYATIIDPSVAVSSGWSLSGSDRDPEGNGVYKKTGLPFAPDVLIADGRFVLTVSRYSGNPPVIYRFDYPDWTIGDKTWINAPANQVRNFGGTYGGLYWTGVGALWGWTNNTAYVRFADGSDANGHSIRIARNGGNIGTEVYTSPGMLIQASYNRVHGFQVRNVAGGIIIKPSGSGTVREVVVTNNFVHSCWQPIVIDSGNTHSNAIVDNIVSQNFYASASAGAWRADNNSDWEQAHFYSFAKNVSSKSQSSPNAINSYRAGSSNLISGNLLTNSVNGIQAGDWTTVVGRGTVVSSNTVKNISSVGIALGNGNGHDETFIHDNLVANANIGYRLQNINSTYSANATTRAWYWGNKFWSPDSKGVAFYFNSSSKTLTFKPTIWIYHNSFEGGSDGISGFTSTGTPQYAQFSLLENVHVLDNIINVVNTIQHETASGPFGTFDYNRFREIGPAATGASWYGTHNVPPNPNYEWGTGSTAPTTLPDFILDDDSPSRAAGLDVTTLSLPGFAGGYYLAPGPNIGAWQFDTGGPEPSMLIGVVSETASAYEKPATAARFIVTRTESTVGAVTVLYTVSGTGTAGVDYDALTGSLVLPDGVATGYVTVTPIYRTGYLGDKTVTVTIDADAAYELRLPIAATITIREGDAPPTNLLRSQFEPGKSYQRGRR